MNSAQQPRRTARPAPAHPRTPKTRTADPKYQQKAQQRGWSCQVCSERYANSVSFCLSCYQSLYYYCYVNSSLFVQPDLAYLSTYFPATPSLKQPEEQPDPSSHPSMEWVEALLV